MLDGLVKSETENVLYLITAEGILSVISEAAPLLIPAIDRSDGRTDIHHVVASLLVGQKQLWISRRDGKMDAAMVGFFANYPLVRVYDLEFIGGVGRKKWLHFEPQISAWANANGATKLNGHFREGWFRVLTGWTPLYQEVSK